VDQKIQLLWQILS